MATERLCEVPGCRLPHRARGFCNLHYKRIQTGVPIDAPRRQPVKGFPCGVDGCELPRLSRGLCAMHYQRDRGTSNVPFDAPRQRAEPGMGSVDRDGYRVLRGQREHRAVMEQTIGRPLLSVESVHHVNGDRGDNRPENLELWSKSQPSGQRVADKVAWAKEILSLYEPEALR